MAEIYSLISKQEDVNIDKIIRNLKIINQRWEKKARELANIFFDYDKLKKDIHNIKPDADLNELTEFLDPFDAINNYEVNLNYLDYIRIWPISETLRYYIDRDLKFINYGIYLKNPLINYEWSSRFLTIMNAYIHQTVPGAFDSNLVFDEYQTFKWNLVNDVSIRYIQYRLYNSLKQEILEYFDGDYENWRSFIQYFLFDHVYTYNKFEDGEAYSNYIYYTFDFTNAQKNRIKIYPDNYFNWYDYSLLKDWSDIHRRFIGAYISELNFYIQQYNIFEYMNHKSEPEMKFTIYLASINKNNRFGATVNDLIVPPIFGNSFDNHYIFSDRILFCFTNKRIQISPRSNYEDDTIIIFPGKIGREFVDSQGNQIKEVTNNPDGNLFAHFEIIAARSNDPTYPADTIRKLNDLVNRGFFSTLIYDDTTTFKRFKSEMLNLNSYHFIVPRLVMQKIFRIYSHPLAYTYSLKDIIFDIAKVYFTKQYLVKNIYPSLSENDMKDIIEGFGLIFNPITKTVQIDIKFFPAWSSYLSYRNSVTLLSQYLPLPHFTWLHDFDNQIDSFYQP